MRSHRPRLLRPIVGSLLAAAPIASLTLASAPAGASGLIPTIASVNGGAPVAATGTLRTITITGSNFDSPKVTIDGGSRVSKILAGSSSTMLKLSIKLPASGAATGAQTVTVANKRGAAATSTLTVDAAPTVSSVEPSSLYRGGSTSIVVTGTGFASNATIDPVSGVTFSGYSVTDGGTKLHATATVAAKPSSARRAIVVRNPSDQGFAPAASVRFTFLDLPRIDNLYYVGQGSAPQQISIVGLPSLGAGQSPAVTVSGSGVSISSPSYSGTTFSGTLSVDQAAATGPRSVTITMPDGSTITNPSGLFVNAAPSVSSIGSVTSDGMQQTIGIRGRSFASNSAGLTPGVNVPTVTVDSPNVHVVTVFYVSSTLMYLTVFTDVCISGSFDVTVTNPGTAGGSTTVSSGLVVGVDPSCPAPISVDPIGTQSTSQTGASLAVTGSGFQAGVLVTSSDGSVIDVTAVTFNSDTSITLTITTGSSSGSADLTFLNPDGGHSTVSVSTS